MNEFTTINYRMLAIARDSRGLTQQELVALIPNLNQGNYSKMEKGLLNVPYETIVNIAKELDYQVSFFYKKGVQTPISSFYYRRRVTMAKKNLNILEAKLDIIRMVVDDLLDSIDIPQYNLPQYRVTEQDTPSEIAVRLRDYLKIPTGPIKNLIKIIEAAGVIVYFIKIDIDKFDGITLVTDKGHPIIFINQSLSNDRKIFTIVHELFHLIAHIPFTPLPIGRDEEKEANEFAGEFLMPYLECRYDLQDLKYSQLSTLKSYWRVSKAAIVYRAKDISAITDEKYTYLNIELSRRGEKKKENGIVELDAPTIMNLVIDVYENQLGYSLNDFIGMLSINSKDYFELFANSKYRIDVKPKTIIFPINKTA